MNKSFQEREAKPISRLYRALESVRDEAELLTEDAGRSTMDEHWTLNISETDFDRLVVLVEVARKAFKQYKESVNYEQ